MLPQSDKNQWETFFSTAAISYNNINKNNSHKRTKCVQAIESQSQTAIAHSIRNDAKDKGNDLRSVLLVSIDMTIIHLSLIRIGQTIGYSR